jgi:hypothetical protein
MELHLDYWLIGKHDWKTSVGGFRPQVKPERSAIREPNVHFSYRRVREDSKTKFNRNGKKNNKQRWIAIDAKAYLIQWYCNGHSNEIHESDSQFQKFDDSRIYKFNCEEITNHSRVECENEDNSGHFNDGLTRNLKKIIRLRQKIRETTNTENRMSPTFGQTLEWQYDSQQKIYEPIRHEQYQ